PNRCRFGSIRPRLLDRASPRGADCNGPNAHERCASWGGLFRQGTAYPVIVKPLPSLSTGVTIFFRPWVSLRFLHGSWSVCAWQEVRGKTKKFLRAFDEGMDSSSRIRPNSGISPRETRIRANSATIRFFPESTVKSKQIGTFNSPLT